MTDTSTRNRNRSQGRLDRDARMGICGSDRSRSFRGNREPNGTSCGNALPGPVHDTRRNCREAALEASRTGLQTLGPTPLTDRTGVVSRHESGTVGNHASGSEGQGIGLFGMCRSSCRRKKSTVHWPNRTFPRCIRDLRVHARHVAVQVAGTRLLAARPAAVTDAGGGVAENADAGEVGNVGRVIVIGAFVASRAVRVGPRSALLAERRCGVCGRGCVVAVYRLRGF
ncbi:hypothetical protein P280DRAFT_193951 [Massarina eburnea CBS 473.64]|uniref:Uncharacterized protein n=1 Tax=Massarina eburnea CBS 473.64 TaxID=1395130 RepID=A0A6A6RN35_9PLEO|nr:hypothetical protein P280DRAFT_193951 [Massarina eburnea CBS 473.64]